VRWRLAALAAGLAVAVVLAGGAAAAPVTLARLTASASASASFSTGSLAAPTALGAAGGAAVSLAWTPSTSATATGYAVLRSATSGSGYAQVGTVTPVSAVAGTDSPGIGTWFYVLQTYRGAWTSGNSNQATAVVSASMSTGTVGCVSQAAETSGSGDNNGYEGNPTKLCAKDGQFATDAATGTNTVNSCTNAGKDRHRAWGYAFGLPGTVSTISGITLTAVLGMNNNGGTNVLCAQLSWDGGTTWTAAKSVALTGQALTTYTLGSASDTWGHAWTSAQLGSTLFRVRLTDVTTTSNKDFQLDFIGAAVQYTP
jgi:hypothetical protein